MGSAQKYQRTAVKCIIKYSVQRLYKLLDRQEGINVLKKRRKWTILQGNATISIALFKLFSSDLTSVPPTFFFVEKN